MAQTYPESPETPASEDTRAGMQRSPEQAAREAAMREVSDTLLNIEQTIRRVERAHRTVTDQVHEPNLKVALAAAKERLQEAHKDLFQGGYFGGGQQRLL